MRIRSLDLEILDQDNVPEKELRSSLSFIRFVNRFLGGTRVILDYFEEHPVPEHFRVLDLGCGAGDIAFAISGWARAHGKQAEIIGLDLNPVCIQYARENFKAPGVRYVQASAFDLDSLGKFDYILASMFFHHLGDEDIARLLRLMAGNARRGFIINDLCRSWPAYCGAVALAAPTFCPIILNDAPLSVKRGFREEDFERYRRSANILTANIKRRPIFRISLSHHA